MSATTVAFMGALVYRHRSLLPILTEHLEDNFDQMLPHMLISDVERWAERVVLAGEPSEEAELAAVIDFLEAGLADGDSEIEELIGASFVEMLPQVTDPAARLRDLLPRRLRAQLWF